MPKYKIKSGTIREGKERYGVGDIIEMSEARASDPHFACKLEAVKVEKAEPAPKPKPKAKTKPKAKSKRKK